MEGEQTVIRSDLNHRSGPISVILVQRLGVCFGRGSAGRAHGLNRPVVGQSGHRLRITLIMNAQNADREHAGGRIQLVKDFLLRVFTIRQLGSGLPKRFPSEFDLVGGVNDTI